MADESNPIPGQQRASRVLSAFLRAGTLPHALLFSGIEGVGKKTAACCLAMVCNCLQPPADFNDALKGQPHRGQGTGPPEAGGASKILEPCGRCRACKKIRSDSHPDIITVKPRKGFIRIEKIRSLCDTLALKPYEARFRVVIIRDAHAMSASAGNALLKVLEEPPQQTILILISARPADLLPTVVSRCQRIRFDPIADRVLAAMLVEDGCVDPSRAAVVAALAEGSHARARQMLESRWPVVREWVLGEIQALSGRQPIRALAFAEKLARDKKSVPEALTIVQSWYRDLMVARYDTARIVNQDFQKEICAAARRHSLAALMAGMEEVSRAQRLMRAHPGANLRLLLEVMVTRLMKYAVSGVRTP